ncbi:MAG TPA: hypothetical protein PKM63_18930 [Panacibacter sp.]|nr:hypothetical protein [Panacibacter sp.]
MKLFFGALFRLSLSSFMAAQQNLQYNSRKALSKSMNDPVQFKIPGTISGYELAKKYKRRNRTWLEFEL